MPRYYKIWADGSCRYGKKSIGYGGFGTIVINKNKIIHKISGYYKNTTHNRMELLAVIAGMKKISKSSNVVVFSDSKYVVYSANRWMKKWMKKGWKTASNKPVANKDLMEQLYKLYNSFKKCKFKWVKGHSNNKWNNMVDQIATNHNKDTNYIIDKQK